jgi:RecB family exonuclease
MTLSESFWEKSLEVAPNEVIQHLDKTLQELLHASAAGKLDIAESRLDSLSPRAARHLYDLHRLHQKMGDILPADLTVIKHIHQIDASVAKFTIHLHNHQDIPQLSYQQSMLVDKIKRDFGNTADKEITGLLSDLFDDHGTDNGTSLALHHLQNNLFAANADRVIQDSSLQWLAVRDYREEVTTAVKMIRQMLADDNTLKCADIAILLPNNDEYTTTMANELDKNGIPCSGLPGSEPVRDLGCELIRNFIAALQPPAPIMAAAALFTSPLMPWSVTNAIRMGQTIMDGYGYPEDNSVTELITNPPQTPTELIAVLERLIDLIGIDDTTARHQSRAQQLVTELIVTLTSCQEIDWMQLERQLTPQQLFDSDKTSYHQEGVGIFLEAQEPWRRCRVLLVLGLTAGHYPAMPTVSPIFSPADVAAINTSDNITRGNLMTNQQLLQQRRLLFKRQLQTATDEITFFAPHRDGGGEHLSTSESLIFMAQLFTNTSEADDLLFYSDDPIQRDKICHLVYIEKAGVPPQLLPRKLEANDLNLNCNLLALRCDKEGNQKPESPSGLETLMVSPLAWLLHRYHLEPQPWCIDTLDVMTRGSLAHSVFEHLFAPDKPVPQSSAIAAQISILLSDAAQEMFPLLLRDEWRIERRNLQRELTVAAQRWGEILTEINATVIGVEVPLNGTLDGTPIAGIADLLLRLPNGRLLVVDYKKSGSSARIKRMDKGYDSQANLYRIMIETGGATDGSTELQQTLRQAQQISVMYYLLNDQTALSDSNNWTQNNIAGWLEMGDAISDNAMALINERITQLCNGQIILNCVDEKTEFEKETGIKPYAFENSPLVELFMTEEINN